MKVHTCRKFVKQYILDIFKLPKIYLYDFVFNYYLSYSYYYSWYFSFFFFFFDTEYTKNSKIQKIRYKNFDIFLGLDHHQ